MSAARNRLAIVLILAAASLGGCSWTSSGMRPVMAMSGEQMDMQDPVGNGRALLMTGQYGLAIDALLQAVEDDPRNVRALALLAVAYDHLKRYDLADRYHAEALQIDPNSVAALNNWGYSFLVRGNQARATGLLQRAAAVGKGQPIVDANLSLLTGGVASRSPVPPQSAPPPETTQLLRLSEHVTLVRRVGHLVRLAPGVQMLVTEPEPAVPAPPLQVSQAAEPAPAELDSRFALFRQLFSLMEGAQIADTKDVAENLPFTVYSDVDDFSTL